MFKQRANRSWFGDSILDGFVLGFACWTLICHAAVMWGGSLHLLLTFAAGITAAGIAIFFLKKHKKPPEPESSELVNRWLDTGQYDEIEEKSLSVRKWLMGWVILTSIISVISYRFYGDFTLCWLIGMAGLLPISLLELATQPRVSPPVSKYWWNLALCLLCATCAVITLTIHRPDEDDAVYLNMAVAAVDEPGEPLMARDSLHGLPESQASMLRLYKVHSIETLTAALAYISGLKVLDVTHLIMPPMAAVLVVLAFTRLFRLLAPDRWLLMVVVAMILLLSIADTHRIYGNFAFVRLHQGKAIFLHVLVPLIVVYGIRFALRPSRRNWVYLGAAQITAVGLTSTAIWVAPIVSGLALVCGLSFRYSPVRTLFLGISSSVYLFLLAIYIRQSIFAESLRMTASTTISSVQNTHMMKWCLEHVLGKGALVVPAMLVIMGGWTLARQPLQKRFFVFFPLGFLILWNPFYDSWIAVHLTGWSTYWRIFWVLPLPVLLALALTSPPRALRLWPLPSWVRNSIILILVLLLVGWGTTTWVISSENHVRVGFPTWKIPQEERTVVSHIAERTNPGSIVLAPESISAWLVVQRKHPLPLVVRRMYTMWVITQLGRKEVQRRHRLEGLVSGSIQSRSAAREIRQAVNDYPLDVVCLSMNGGTPEIRANLKDAGMKITFGTLRYEVWSRP